ncbi:F-box/kelch-repeat protein At3g23880-like isoform X1 [Prosopis cineraria]|uniref:F-box/kelch-repeat protein At3g23880-like isoform X1 n=1 Tax=Prosopis cineraria TaxID=364024 RepID=UPI0024103DA2|nr:F-box/kelch-repeat protein At3g23880-like isoform X1 [Prosopis cineraria]XP_054795731.1 F-box/kelch-repeat protein At3g23880-like isoform X1 [Prosopis cineraria]
MAPKVMDSDTPFLPEEIMIDILKRLPVKSLIRFQCVCQRWKNLFKTSSFIAEHLNHSSKNPSLLFQTYDRFDCLQMLNYEMQVLEVQFEILPLIGSFRRAQIIGCSNGLFCVKRDYTVLPLPSLLVWNPATREVRQIPEPINHDGDFYEFGFGFSPIVNDYKIVIARETEIDLEGNGVSYRITGAEVYSLSEGSWKEIQVGDVGVLNLVGLPVTVNGAIFWNGYKMDRDYLKVCEEVIVSFDIAMEVFTFIPSPSEIDSCNLTVHENKLAILSRLMNGYGESSVIDLWVTEEVAGASEERWSWTRKYSISTCPFTNPKESLVPARNTTVEEHAMAQRGETGLRRSLRIRRPTWKLRAAAS